VEFPLQPFFHPIFEAASRFGNSGTLRGRPKDFFERHAGNQHVLDQGIGFAVPPVADQEAQRGVEERESLGHAFQGLAEPSGRARRLILGLDLRGDVAAGSTVAPERSGGVENRKPGIPEIELVPIVAGNLVGEIPEGTERFARGTPARFYRWV